MNRLHQLLLIAVLFGACKPNEKTVEEVALVPKSEVTITNVSYGTVSDNLELFATTLYLKRNIATSPFPAYITNIRVRLGGRVSKGEILYELETKERRALKGDIQKIDSSLKGFGIIQVRSPADGIVSTFDKQQVGDYVLEGAQLCTIAESGDLAFQLNVPYDYIKYVPIGKKCQIVLPDNSRHTVTISTPLSTMNMTAQTQSVLAKSTESIFLPENLIVRVIISKGMDKSKQILPKSCIQSDEMMKNFWVMKLINDSTAVRLPVTVGNKNESEAEILNPKILPSDRIILSGSYGLGDTALVKIKK